MNVLDLLNATALGSVHILLIPSYNHQLTVGDLELSFQDNAMCIWICDQGSDVTFNATDHSVVVHLDWEQYTAM